MNELEKVRREASQARRQSTAQARQKTWDKMDQAITNPKIRAEHRQINERVKRSLED